MLKEKHLTKEDQLIYNLYKKLEMKEAEFILIKDSIKEDEKGIELTIIEPIIKWSSTEKTEESKRRKLFITKTGNIEVLSEKDEKGNEETIDTFLNRIIYRIEPCTEELIRMTKETTSIDFKIQENSLRKVKTLSPKIIYLNSLGQVLDIIELEKKEEEKPKVYTK